MTGDEIRALIADSVKATRDLSPSQAADLIYMDLSTKALITDARLLRWCEWPECLRSYNVLTGPNPEIDGRGWIRVNRTLFCPDHADAGHRPQRPEWESGSPTMTASCECGASDGTVRASLAANNEWWAAHVLEATR